MKKFLTKYDHAEPVSPHGDDVSLTDQQYKNDCDIDIILKRYRAGQPLPVGREGRFGDFSDVGDFQTAFEKVRSAISDFESMPAKLRDRFSNDPAVFYDFILNPANIEECRRLGLAKPAPIKPKEVTRSAETPKDGSGNAKTT